MIKLLKLLKPYKFLIALIFILTFTQAMSEVYLPTLMSDIVNVGILRGDVNYILGIGKYMILVALISATSVILDSFIVAKVAIGFGKSLRSMLFSKVESFSLHEFDTIGTASLVTRATNDILQVQQMLVMILRTMIFAPMMLIGSIIMAVSKDAKLSLILLIIMPAIGICVFVAGKKSMPLFKAMQKKLDKLNLVLRENLTGIRVIRAFNRIDNEKKKFNKANKDLANISIKANLIMAVSVPLMMFIMNVTTVAVLWFGGLRIESGNMQIGDLIAYIQYITHVMVSIIFVSMIFTMIPRAEASAIRVQEVFDVVPEIKDREEVKTTKEQKGFLEFKDVTFSYSGAEQPALSHISFSAKPGEITAIIGSTGSGKSTLISLIPRFYNISEGSILVDGVDIGDMSQEDLRARIGLVPQQAILFSGTITDNIRYGKKDANEKEVLHAAEIAQASEFISNMKDGFNSVISQGGNNVSGGQKQRLSIARALVRRPEIYIFDDSFSALDFKTDAKLRAALRKETSDATVIIVAQRVSTVMDVDRIIVLDEGNIVGMGSHRELLNTCDIYKEIVSSQLLEEELA